MFYPLSYHLLLALKDRRDGIEQCPVENYHHHLGIGSAPHDFDVDGDFSFSPQHARMYSYFACRDFSLAEP